MLMIAAYNEKWEGKTINSWNVLRYTDRDFFFWITISGLRDGNVPFFAGAHNFKITGEYPTFTILGDNRNFIIRITVDLYERTISDELCVIKLEQNRGSGYKAFKRQLELSAAMDFKRLDCLAYRGRIGKWESVGYLVWGKFGFTMIEDSHAAFLEQMKTDARAEKVLHDLLSSETGLQYWKDAGKSWEGEFLIEQSSRNYSIFLGYEKSLSKR